MTLFAIAEKLMEKRELRTGIGWVDWSTDSWDRRECERRAWRILARTQGIHTNHWGDEK